MKGTTFCALFVLLLALNFDLALGKKHKSKERADKGQISFFSDGQFQNSLATYNRPRKCSNLHSDINNKVRGVTTTGGCFELYDKKKCKGRHVRIEADQSVDLADCDFDDEVDSIRACKKGKHGKHGKHHGKHGKKGKHQSITCEGKPANASAPLNQGSATQVKAGGKGKESEDNGGDEDGDDDDDDDDDE